MTLRISNATVNETGQYRCSYQGLRAEEGKTSAGVYVFVHGASRPQQLPHMSSIANTP